MAHTQAWGSEWPRGTRPTRLRSAKGTKHRIQGRSQPSTQTGQKEPLQKTSENTDPTEEHKPSKGAGSKEDHRTVSTVVGRGRKGTLGCNQPIPEQLAVFQVARASWLADWFLKCLGGQNVHKSQPPERGKQPIILCLARKHSERSWLERGSRLRADGTATGNLLHAHAHGKGAGGWRRHFTSAEDREGCRVTLVRLCFLGWLCHQWNA